MGHSKGWQWVGDTLGKVQGMDKGTPGKFCSLCLKTHSSLFPPKSHLLPRLG